MTAAVWLFLSRTFTGRAILAVAQDRLALQLMGADPVRIKQFAFGLAIATTAIAGALLIIIGPVEPSLGRVYIGRAFAIVVLRITSYNVCYTKLLRFERLLVQVPNDGLLWYAKGEVYRLRAEPGDLERAADAYAHALKAEGAPAETYRSMARVVV